jgi:hypothetical protein
MIHRCCICDQPAYNQLGLRCRVKSEYGLKKKSHAVWAPDLNGWLCDTHALGGINATLYVTSNGRQKTVISVDGEAPVITRIKDPL